MAERTVLTLEGARIVDIGPTDAIDGKAYLVIGPDGTILWREDSLDAATAWLLQHRPAVRSGPGLRKP